MASKETRRDPWFESKGWFYIPRSWQACLIFGIALAFCVNVTILIYERSQSLSDTLYGVFPYLICIFLLLDWIASKKTSKR
jgi:hypothetical protein